MGMAADISVHATESHPYGAESSSRSWHIALDVRIANDHL